MDGMELALACREYADNKKAEEIMVLDMREVSTITDYFVIASGTSAPHVRAIWNEIVDGLKQDHQLTPPPPEGAQYNTWVVIDYFDVIVHVMSHETRQKYDLEGLWNDAAVIEPAVTTGS
jgi:ribosome-associated protein